MPSIKNIVIVVSLLFFSLFSLLLYFTTPSFDAHQEIDSPEYEEVAYEYVKTGVLAHPQHGMPVHPAGYYWLLGILYTYISTNQSVVFFVQWVLSLFCFWFIYKTALVMFGLPVALGSILLASCNLGFIVFSQLILAEIFLVTLLSWFLYCVVMLYQSRNIKYAARSGLLLVASVLVKPVALFYGLAMPFFVGGVNLGSFANRFKAILLFLLFFYLPLVGYMIYNYKLFNTFAVTTLHTGNLYYYFLPRRILPRLEERERKEVEQYLAVTNPKKLEHRLSFVFFDLLAKHPFIYAVALIESMIKIFFGLYATQLKVMYNTVLRGGSLSFFAMHGSSLLCKLYNYTQFGTDNAILKIISLFELCWLFVLYFLLSYAFVSLLYKRRYFFILLWGSYVGYITLAAAFDGCGRYRMMLEPVFLILAVYALLELYTGLKNYCVFYAKRLYARSRA
jgi:4-amino-4-deoxy-L-arabinose transferase-like glycosyltransferase